MIYYYNYLDSLIFSDLTSLNSLSELWVPVTTTGMALFPGSLSTVPRLFL